MAYTPHKGRTTKQLQYYLSVCSKNGYHCAFPYGWKLPTTTAYLSETLRRSVFHGWTLRVFFYVVNSDVGKSLVQISLDGIYQSTNFIATEAKESGFVDTYGQAKGLRFFGRYTGRVKQGDHFSIGIQVDGEIPNFKGVFNEASLSTRNLEDVKDLKKWTYTIIADTNIITSIHVYDDIGTHFPKEGFREQYFLATVPLPLASYAVFQLKYVGHPSQPYFRVIIRDNKEVRAAAYTRHGVQTGGEITVYIRNVPTGWLVQPSFQAVAELLPRKHVDNVISPEFANGNIQRIYMESSMES